MIRYVMSYRIDGLGQRLSRVLSGMRIAHDYGLKYVCVWPLHRHHCDIPLHQILCPNSLITIRPTARYIGRLYKLRKASADVLCDNRYGTIRIDRGCPVCFVDEDRSKVRGTLKYIADNCIDWNCHLLNKVDAFLQQHDLCDVVAVHVRRGDLAHATARMAARATRTQVYFDFLDKLQDSKLMLFTDSANVVGQFASRYDILKYPVKNFGRRGNAVFDAAIELLLMSKCKRIVGGHSYFSKTAAMIGNTPLTLLQNSVPVSEWDGKI